MDEDSKSKAERRGLIEGESGFEVTSQYIDDLINKVAADKTLSDYSKKAPGTAMDLSAVSPATGGTPGADAEKEDTPQEDQEGQEDSE